jgi:hypothetical protein
MGYDAPINTLLNVKSLLATDEIYVARISTNQDCYILGSDLIAASKSNNPVTKVICPFNQNTTIVLASQDLVQSDNFKSILLHCYFERNGQSRSELVTVSYTDRDTSIGESVANTIPTSITDLGITLSSNEYYTLNLIVSVDNSSPYNVLFYYNVVSIITL